MLEAAVVAFQYPVSLHHFIFMFQSKTNTIEHVFMLLQLHSMVFSNKAVELSKANRQERKVSPLPACYCQPHLQNRTKSQNLTTGTQNPALSKMWSLQLFGNTEKNTLIICFGRSLC